jgi:hypothetical protein
VQETPNERSNRFPPQKSSLGERMNDTSTIMIKKDGKWIWLDNGEEVKNPPDGSSQESKPQTSKELGSLDSDYIPIRVRFDPMNGRYFERLMNVNWGDKDHENKVNSLGYDELALVLMLQYFVLISGGTADVSELETAFVNRQRTADINPKSGDLFSGLTFIEMVNRANRAYRNAKRLPKLLERYSGQGPLEIFSDDEIAELNLVAHASITGRIKIDFYVGKYFKHIAGEYYERIK